MGNLFLRLGRVLARFNLWIPSALVFSWVRPSAQATAEFQTYFAYSCMMGRQSRNVRRAFVRVLRREIDFSAQTNLWIAFTALRMGRSGLAMSIYRRTEKLYRGTPEAYVAARQTQFASLTRNALLPEAIASSLGKLLEAAREHEPFIVVPVSSRFLDLFYVWREQVALHAKGRVLVLAMDKVARQSLFDTEHFNVIDLSEYFDFDNAGKIERYSKQHLWVLRVLVLREIIGRGLSVISLDLDAILVGDLEALLRHLPSADIVAQQDYSIPMDVARTQGFIVCCGFMVIRSNPATMQFMERYSQQVMRELDDQISVNHLLAEDKLNNYVARDNCLTFESAGVSWVCPSRLLVSRDVRSGTVIRHFQQHGESLEELRVFLGIEKVRLAVEERTIPMDSELC